MFFLSHAAGDDDYVRRFYRDLSAEVTRRSGVGDVGFLDIAGHEHGDRWPVAVDDAVRTCRVFVALCSPRYFRNERCGRAWSVFADRLRRYQDTTGVDAPALLPVLWATTDLPASAVTAAGPQVLVPASPGGAGLHRLIRLKAWRNEYLSFVSDLARRIVDSAQAHPVPPAVGGMLLATAPNAFEPSDPGSTPGRELGGPSARTAQRVHFVVAAGTRDEMGAIRSDASYYGATGLDWAPYRPALPEPLAAHACAVVAERHPASEIADLDALLDRIEDAHRNNDIVVLLVDAWATKLEAYRDTLVEFDRHGASTVAVLAPASREDAETTRHRAELKAELAATFRSVAARQDPVFRIEIETVAGFDDDLMAVLEAAQNKIYRRGRVFRRPAIRPSAERPILEGP